jgi:hypothetical protein
VKLAPVLPTIHHITPSIVKVGTKAFILTVTGEHFAKGNRVLWKGVARKTTFVSATTIRAKVLANDIAKAGRYVVSVYRPGRDAATSNGWHSPYGSEGEVGESPLGYSTHQIFLAPAVLVPE